MTSSYGVEKNRINKEQVVTLLKSVEDAARELEVDPIIAQLADDVVITIRISGPQGKKDLQFDRKKYEAFLKQGMAVITSYVVEYTDRKITITGDGQSAQVTEILLEKSTVGGKQIICKSRQTIGLALQGGKLLVNRLDAEVLSLQQSANVSNSKDGKLTTAAP
jgi:hypothetical protein